jgi:hypothetical protein
MQFLRKMRQRFATKSGTQDGGLYFYIRLYKTPRQPSPDDEIIRLRVHPHNDLSTDDDGHLFLRKTVSGSHTFRRADLVLYFDDQHRLKGHEIDGGELSTDEEYNRYLAGRAELPTQTGGA